MPTLPRNDSAQPATSAPRPRRRKRWLVLAVLLILAGLFAWSRHTPPLRVSPETTIITSPLLPDGRPDYVAYLNAKYSEGVTPENNAMVILARVVGRSAISPVYRRSYFDALGMVPCGDGDTWILWGSFAAQHGIDEDRVRIAQHIIWNPETLRPEIDSDVVEFIAANRAVYDLVLEAVKRERFFCPILNGEGQSLFQAEGGLHHPFRELAGMLELRFHYWMKAGDRAAAIDDLLALATLGRFLQARSDFLVNAVGRGMDSSSINLASELFKSPELTLPEFRDLKQGWEKLPPPSPLRDLVNVRLRFNSLDTAIETSVGNDVPSSVFLGTSSLGWVRLRFAAGTDINQILMSINRSFDEIVSIQTIPDLPRRNARMIAWTAKKEAQFNALPRPHPWLTRYYKWRGEIPVYSIGEDEAAPVFVDVAQLFNFWRESEVTYHLVDAAFRVKEYQLTSGELPASLEPLIDSNSIEDLSDPWTGERLRYAPHGTTFAVWSVGPNLIDDRGWEYWEVQMQTVVDDPDDIRFGPPPEESGVSPESEGAER